jgi:pyocin large subunit-like protein
MQQRYYDPVIGRFYSNDPVDFMGHMQRGNPTMGFNRYAYANNNPYKYTDPDGRYIESLWDATSLSIGVVSLKNNISAGNWGAAAVDAGGIVVDGLAMALPVVPGGAGAAISGVRGAESAVNAVQLEKQLASESQLSQLAEGGGSVISQPAKQADRIASQNGVESANVQKVSSDSFKAKDGSTVQTHAFRDAATNKVIEPKTIINEEKR